MKTSPDDVRSRLYWGAFILFAVTVIGSAGYVVIGGGRWNWSECLYMTVITLATVGYGETLAGMETVPYARAWTMLQIMLGSGAAVYFVSTLTAFVVEGDLGGALRRNRMQKRIDALENHLILVGAGALGLHVAAEIRGRQPFVVIELDPERIEKLREVIDPEVLCIEGDASEDHVLEAAGIKRAQGMATTLRDDRDNLFVSITARALNPSLRIVSKVTEDSTEQKLKRAGANAVVSPAIIGGMRIASELLRPNVVRFLDQMLRERDRPLRIEEVSIPDTSSLVGCALSATTIRKATDVLVLAIQHADGRYHYKPGPDAVLERGMTLIVLAETDELSLLRKGIASGSIGRA